MMQATCLRVSGQMCPPIIDPVAAKPVRLQNCVSLVVRSNQSVLSKEGRWLHVWFCGEWTVYCIICVLIVKFSYFMFIQCNRILLL